MDRFVENTGAGPTLGECLIPAQPATPGNYAVMDYYDGNTVTALWNSAQRFAMSDNSFGTGYGPSTPGALNLVSGNPFGATWGGFNGPACAPGFSTASMPGVPAPQGAGTVTNDPQPF